LSLGDNTYRPTERDLEAIGAAPTRLLLLLQQSAASATLSQFSSAVPGDEVWLIKHTSIRFTPGAAQTLTLGAIVVRDTSGNVIGRVHEIAPPQASAVAAAASVDSKMIGDVMVFPGDAIEAAATFNAGAAANSMFCAVWGIRLPRGNALK